MRTGKVLVSALQFFVSVKLMLLGAFLIALSLMPYARSLFLDIFAEHPGIFSLLGYLILGVGVLLFIAFYAINRGQYYQVSVRNPPVSVDTSLIQQYADDFWKKHFPLEALSSEVVMHSNQRIELIAEIEEMSVEKQKVLLEKTEKELGDLLARNLGYDREFFVTLVIK